MELFVSLLAIVGCVVIFLAFIVVMFAMQMKADEERALEDAEFVAQMAKRRSGNHG